MFFCVALVLGQFYEIKKNNNQNIDNACTLNHYQSEEFLSDL